MSRGVKLGLVPAIENQHVEAQALAHELTTCDIAELSDYAQIAELLAAAAEGLPYGHPSKRQVDQARVVLSRVRMRDMDRENPAHGRIGGLVAPVLAHTDLPDGAA